MIASRRRSINLYVDRASGQWIVMDLDGNWWLLPSSEDEPWHQREPFYPTEETDLELVPGHYKFMLGLPDERSVGTS